MSMPTRQSLGCTGGEKEQWYATATVIDQIEVKGAVSGAELVISGQGSYSSITCGSRSEADYAVQRLLQDHGGRA